MTDTVKLKAADARRWAAAKMTFRPVARRLVANKARFQAMETRTGVPWFLSSAEGWAHSTGIGD